PVETGACASHPRHTFRQASLSLFSSLEGQVGRELLSEVLLHDGFGSFDLTPWPFTQPFLRARLDESVRQYPFPPILKASEADLQIANLVAERVELAHLFLEAL